MEQTVQQVRQDLPVLLVHKVHKGQLALPDQLVLTVRMDLPVLKVLKDLLVQPALKDQSDLPDHVVQLDLPVLSAHKVRLDQ
jgi:hypothetical protein